MSGTDVLPAELFGAFAFAFGLVIGSFLNVVIYRLPRGESLVHPRSHCPACGTMVAAWDNVPVLSYLWLRGRCRHCAARISPRYPLVELFTAVIFGALALRHGPIAMTPVWCAFAAALIAAAIIDFDRRIIPDEISLGGLLLAVILVPGVRAATGTPLVEALTTTFAGALLGGGLLWFVGFTHARISEALGREFEHWPGPGEERPRPNELDYWVWFPGLGFGDVKLLALVGAVLGPVGALETIFAAALCGLILGLGFALLTRRWNAPFGFGPAIAVGALVVLLLPADLHLF